MPASKVVDYIVAQIDKLHNELAAYEPISMDWRNRVNASAERLTSWLVQTAPQHRQFVQDVLNAPTELRAIWSQIRAEIDIDPRTIRRFDKLLTLDNIIRESLTGEIISKVFSMSLMDCFPGRHLKSNSRSDYPDLYLSDLDYSGLPKPYFEACGPPRTNAECG